jgi:hypothetical protein
MLESAELTPATESFGLPSAPALPAAPKVARTRTIGGARLVLGAALGTRLLVWAAALVTIAIFGELGTARHVVDPAGVTPSLHAGVLSQLLTPGVRWDSVWYVQIARHGYFSPASTNFFPLYPLLVHLLTPLFGNTIVAGIALSVGAMVGGLMLLYRLAVLDLDESGARTTVILVAVFPTSLFLSAMYPTSLFMMLIVAAVYAARREQWALAGLCGGLAAATRSNGIFVVILLALLYLYGPRGRRPLPDRVDAWWRPRFRVERDVAWLALVPAGLGMYLGYLWIAHGAPLAPYRAASLYWDHSFGPPLGGIIDAFGALPRDVSAVIGGHLTPLGPGDPIGWQARNLIDLLFLGLALLALALGWNRVPRVYVIFAAFALAQVTSFPIPHEPMIGLGRYMLPMFGLFMGAGAYLAERRTARRVTVLVSTVLLVLFSGLWGYWALVP